MQGSDSSDGEGGARGGAQPSARDAIDYWTQVKTGDGLLQPGILEYDIGKDILWMQLESTYHKLAKDQGAFFLFDPNKYQRDDQTLVTSNY